MEEPTETMCCQCNPELAKFDEGDPEYPINWTRRKKYAVNTIVCLLSLISTMGTSSYAAGQPYLMYKYNISTDLASSGLSLNVFGMAMGPLIWGPLSELYGRKLPYLLSWPLLIGLTAPCAFVDNIIVILIFRFFTGCCIGNAINNGAGVISDLYQNDAAARAKSVAIFVFCGISGPCYGSFMGFFVASAGWPGFWVLRMHLFLCLACFPLVFILPETHGPTILKRRAHTLRIKGNIHAFSHEELEHATFGDIVQIHLLRPLKMLMFEPISQGSALWIGLAYGIMYFFFEVYPIVFIEQHNIPFRYCGAMFLFIPVGMLMAVVLYPCLIKLFARLPLPGIKPKGRRLNEAERRLTVVIPACVAMPISLLWLGWTSGPETHWFIPALAGVLFGYSLMGIFISLFAYMTHIYSIYSSSAAAANTLARSIFGAIFPIVTRSIINAIGTKWGLSIFAFISVGLLPIPLIFIRYGKGLRARSRYGQEAREVIVRMSIVEVVGGDFVRVTVARATKKKEVARGVQDEEKGLDEEEIESSREEGLEEIESSREEGLEEIESSREGGLDSGRNEEDLEQQAGVQDQELGYVDE
ncbi:MFS general substrate transporter [Russula dissimulans]|nr:MFS general substrate transporter [Russula dissimulans]